MLVSLLEGQTCSSRSPAQSLTVSSRLLNVPRWGALCRYLLKAWLLKGKTDDMYRAMWEAAMDDMIACLLFETYPNRLKYIATFERCAAHCRFCLLCHVLRWQSFPPLAELLSLLLLCADSCFTELHALLTWFPKLKHSPAQSVSIVCGHAHRSSVRSQRLMKFSNCNKLTGLTCGAQWVHFTPLGAPGLLHPSHACAWSKGGGCDRRESRALSVAGQRPDVHLLADV